MVCRYVEIRCQVNVSGIMVWISHKNQARTTLNEIQNALTWTINSSPSLLSYIIERSSSTGLHHWARPALDPGSLISSSTEKNIYPIGRSIASIARALPIDQSIASIARALCRSDRSINWSKCAVLIMSSSGKFKVSNIIMCFYVIS